MKYVGIRPNNGQSMQLGSRYFLAGVRVQLYSYQKGQIPTLIMGKYNGPRLDPWRTLALI